MRESGFQRRYARHLSLEGVGIEGQKRLSQSKVLVVGVGGLGAPIVLYLAAAGVGTIGLIDGDVVSISNLQRQILFTTGDEGRSKVEMAAVRLRALNPDCILNTYNDFFSALNAESIVSEYDLVIDGSDNFATKYLVNDVCYKLHKPMVFGAVDQFEGQTAIFVPGYDHQLGAVGSSCYRCLYPVESKAKVRNCAEAGVIGSLVGVIGTLQATLALNWIISSGQREHPLCPPVGRVTMMKLDSFESFKYQVKKREACPICSLNPKDIKLEFEASICASTNEISWDQMMGLQEKNDCLLIDVRELKEWEQGHLLGAIHWPLSALEKREIDMSCAKGKRLFVYCQRGIRSLAAIEYLSATTNSIYSINGGLDRYRGELSFG